MLMWAQNLSYSPKYFQFFMAGRSLELTDCWFAGTDCIVALCWFQLPEEPDLKMKFIDSLMK